MREFVSVMASIFILAVVMFSAFIALIIVTDKYSCESYSSVTGKATKYAGMTCYIQDGDQWYAWSEYKNRLVATGSMSH